MIESPRTILVTGHDGFVGRTLSQRLKRNGHIIRGFDRSVNPQHDITDPRAVSKALEGCDMVFNLAARLGTEQVTNGPSFVASNVLGAANVFEAATQQGTPVIHASKPNPWNNFYSATKRAAEDLAAVYNAELGGQIRVVRMFNLYGPDQHYGHKHPEKFGPTFVMDALHNRPLRVYGSGDQRCDFTYIDDAVEGLVQAAFLPELDGPIEIGTGEAVSVNDMAQLVIALSNSSSRIEHVPMRPGEPDEETSVIADTTRMHELLGYHPTTALKDGVRQTLYYYRNLLES